MTRLLFLFYLLLSSLISKAQENLILNPSCEEHMQIPNNTAGYEYCENWWKPHILTTDYFTSLTESSNPNFIPENVFGFQNIIDGNYYIGGALVHWAYSLNDYNIFRDDYFAGRFTQVLQKDKIYQFEFWMSKAENGFLGSNAIDLVITFDTLIDVNDFSNFGYKIWSEDIPMSDTVDWVKISTCFKAKGTETAFAIGNFHIKSDVTIIFPPNQGQPGDMDYRYLDNFSLIECPTCCPYQFPPEQHVYVFSSPSAQNSPTSLQVWLSPNTAGELKIYDSAGRLVAQKSYTELENNFVFENFAAGIYHFALSTSDGVLENGKVLVNQK